MWETAGRLHSHPVYLSSPLYTYSFIIYYTLSIEQNSSILVYYSISSFFSPNPLPFLLFLKISLFINFPKMHRLVLRGLCTSSRRTGAVEWANCISSPLSFHFIFGQNSYLSPLYLSLLYQFISFLFLFHQPNINYWSYSEISPLTIYIVFNIYHTCYHHWPLIF